MAAFMKIHVFLGISTGNYAFRTLACSQCKINTSRPLLGGNRLKCMANGILCRRSCRMYSTAETVTSTSTDSRNNSGQEQKKSSWKSYWTGKNAWRLSFLTLGVMGVGATGLVITEWGTPPKDQDGELIPDRFSDCHPLEAYPLRAWNAVKDFFQMVRDPTSEKLLPDPLPPPYAQPPYTLILEITDVLLKPEWDLQSGWKFKKRPGIDYFLQQCFKAGYEIVVFSKESAQNAYPLVAQLDQQGLIWYKLFKEDTRYVKGVHIKDLTCINRPLEKVIHIDVDRAAYSLNPRNGLALPHWDGKDDDRALYDLAAFLHTIASKHVEDVRSVISHYNQFDDPLAKFRENMAIAQKNLDDMKKIKTELIKTGSKVPLKLPPDIKRQLK